MNKAVEKAEKAVCQKASEIAYANSEKIEDRTIQSQYYELIKSAIV